MKILLANSYFLERDANEQKIMKPYPPLGMLYLSSYLKQNGHAVQVFDSTFLSFPNFKEHILQYKPDLVGIYANVITREISMEMIQKARAMDYPVIAGGPDPSGDPQAYLEAGAHAIVRGEGEGTVQNLVQQMEKEGLNGHLREIPGLYLPDGRRRPFFTGKRDRIDDLDALPMPDRRALDMKKYMQAWREKHGYASVSLITSRGCPYQCTWCSKEIFGSVFRQRSPRSVISEIKSLCDAYAPDQMWIADDVLSLNRDWALQFARSMKQEGIRIPFECLSRVDRIDAEVLELLKEAGCFRIWYGAESGSERMVRTMRKDFTVAQVRKSVLMTKRAGIEAGLFILIGYPGERLRDLLKTLSMIRELSPHYCGSSVAFPIKGTRFYEEVKHLLSDDYSWSRRNENRLSFRGRYPALFYWCAVRLVNNWAAFWSCRNRRDSLIKKSMRLLKIIVTGSGAFAIGTFYNAKQKISPPTRG